jgi:hypothetical protein
VASPRQGFAYVPGNSPLSWSSPKKRQDDAGGLVHDVVDR